MIEKEKIKKEIQRRLQESEERLSHIKARGWVAPNEEQLIVNLKGLLSFINTLEVKKVDNVWHDASETPKGAGDKEILVQFSDWHTSVFEIDDWEYLDHQTKWAYLKDLL